VQMFHVPKAHTDGDILVFFRRSDVIATGDLFVTTSYPFIDVASGGHVNGVIDGLNKIIELAVPSNVQEGGTMIIPGHGRLCDEWEVVEYRDMVTIVRDRVQALIKRGMTLDQIKATKPTLEYDARFGTDTGFWTTTMFVETVYSNLAPATPAAPARATPRPRSSN
jgi:cyclase